jgi:inorganic pyrophosphatase
VNLITAFIQCESGSRIKKRHNESTLEYTGAIELREPYPFPYAFILHTQATDGDCLDCYILTNRQLFTGSQVSVTPVGVLEMFEDGEPDHKILAAFPNELKASSTEDISAIETFISKVAYQFPDMDFSIGAVRDESVARQMIEDARAYSNGTRSE